MGGVRGDLPQFQYGKSEKCSIPYSSFRRASLLYDFLMSSVVQYECRFLFFPLEFSMDEYDQNAVREEVCWICKKPIGTQKKDGKDGMTDEFGFSCHRRCYDARTGNPVTKQNPK
jgi:hypothetical protein